MQVVLPIWLVLLWASYSLVMTSGFQFLRNYPWQLQSVIGGLCGLTGYGAAYLLGSVDFNTPPMPTLLLIVFLWSILLPLWLLMINKFLAGAKTYE
jgi:hypothetical protein